MINSDMKKVIIYSGRFQPMLKHHSEVYRRLQSDNPDAEVYVATSDKSDQASSPFNFQEKQKIVSAHGISTDKIISVKMPYNKDEYDQYFDENNTVLIFAVGGKDQARFPFSNTDPKTGLDMYLKDHTKPKYHQPYESMSSDPQPMKNRGYIMYVDTVEDDSGEIASASKFRSAIKAAPDEQSAKDVVVKQFGRFDQEVFDLIYNRIKGIKMKEHVEILRKLAGIVEAPVRMPDFDKGERPKDAKEREAYRAWKQAKDSGASAQVVAQAVTGQGTLPTSAKDARDAASRPEKAAASDPLRATFTKIKPEDMKQDGKSIPSKQRKQSLANRFPAGADINDPETKKQLFLRVAARSPYMLFSELNARLGNDDNSLAVSDRLSDIVSQFADGKSLMQISAEDKNFALKVLGNAIDNMELVKASEVDRVFDDPEDQEELKDSVDLNDIRSDYGVEENALLDNNRLTDLAEQDSIDAVAGSITHRIMSQHLDLLGQYGPEKVMAAIDEVAEFVGEVDEIGSSDVSGWVRHVEQMLGNMDDMDESIQLSNLQKTESYQDELQHQGVAEDVINQTSTNAMEAALAELRKLAGI